MQGIRSRKEEIVEYIERCKVSVAATQEAKLAKYNQFNLPNYNVFMKDKKCNPFLHGGVTVFIHNSVQYKIIHVNAPIQAVTAIV